MYRKTREDAIVSLAQEERKKKIRRQTIAL